MSGKGDGEAERPERRALGRQLDDEVVRSRLIERLDDRWNCRLTLIEAPGGFGKSTAIAQAVRDNDEDPSGVDVFVRCRPGRAEVEHIATGLLGAMGRRTPNNPTADSLAAAVVAAVADSTPHDVCLCIDDVHLAAEDVSEWLTTVLGGLPFNGHVLLSGRSLPELKLSRLRAGDDVVEIDESELAFDDREIGELARLHHVDPAELGGAGGWPAVTRLGLLAPGGASTDFVIEEIVDELTAPQRRGVATAVVAGVASAALLRAAGVVDEALVGKVPLLVDYGDGAIGAHDLWHEIVDHLVGERELVDIVITVVDHQQAGGEIVDAVETAFRFAQWELALERVMAVFVDGDDLARVDDIDRWLGCVPAMFADRPEVTFLRGLRERMTGRLDEAKRLLFDAAAGFEAVADLDGETTTVLELGMTGWLTGDRGIWKEVGQRSQRVIAAGGTRMQQRSLTGLVAEADLRGDFARAMALQESRDEWDEISLRHVASIAIILGDVGRARRYADLMAERFPKPLVIGHRNVTYWQLGDPSHLLSTRRISTALLGNRRNELITMFFDAMVSASLGSVPDADAVEAVGWSRSREQTFIALVHAAKDLLTGDESLAAEAFATRLDSIGRDDTLMRGELLRCLPYGYVLVDWVRDWIDAAEDLGPLHVERRRFMRRFVAARTSPGMPIGDLPEPATIMTWLPLPWSIELAVLLAAADDRRGIELAAYLADTAGAATHTEIRRLSESRPELSKHADSILAVVAAPPLSATEIVLCEQFDVAPGGSQMSRQRVRQVIALLALRPRWDRGDLVAALWPDQDSSKARGNLRATLGFVRSLLEPDRRTGEAAFHVRQREDQVWLHRSPLLDVDLWRLEHTLAEADALERDHRQAERTLGLRLSALSMWTPRALHDLVDIDMVENDLVDLRRRVIRGGCWAAERLLSNGDGRSALDVGARLIELDRYDERAHDIVIGVHLTSGDHDGAERAIAQLLEALADLGLSPSSGSEMLIRRFERRSGRAMRRHLSAG
ncbi:MAG: BTAD domain-containing putative transcriptional regulator [Ilumatobacter sp.]